MGTDNKQPRQPKGSSKGGQFARSVSPNEVEASLHLSNQNDKPTSCSVALEFGAYYPEPQGSLDFREGEWVWQPSVSYGRMSTKMTSIDTLEGHERYRDITTITCIGNILAELLNTKQVCMDDVKTFCGDTDSHHGVEPTGAPEAPQSRSYCIACVGLHARRYWTHTEKRTFTVFGRMDERYVGPRENF